MRIAPAAAIWIAILSARASGIDVPPIHPPLDSPIRDRILTKGVHHGDEMKARDGSTWMGLFANSDGTYALRPVRIRVRTVLDPISDELTAKDVTTATRQEPVFLVSTALGLRSRAVPTFFHGSLYLHEDNRVEFRWRGSRVILGVQSSGTKMKLDDRSFAIHHVYLEQDDNRFPLPVQLAPNTYSGAELVWAGDLDGDSKPDFLFQETGANWGALRLFLSTAAANGSPVGEVAFHYSTGC